MKKLYRIEEGKMIFGVCGGVAEYFGIDPTIVRIGWLFLIFATVSAFLWLYIIAAIIMPSKRSLPPDVKGTVYDEEKK
jgi:phage shock protein PspC (stress-responsive transcriptional regulator)